MKKIIFLLICFFFATTCYGFTPGSGVANPKNIPAVETFGMCWNGATWDRCSVSGNTRTLVSSSAFITVAATTTTQIVALSAGTSIKVYDIIATIPNGTGITFVYGTGTNCGTGTTDLTHNIISSPGASIISSLAFMSPNFPIITAPAGNALCVRTSSAASTGVTISYIQE